MKKKEKKTNMSNEILKHFGNLVACQINEHPYPFPCPRCGKHSLAFGIFPAVQPKISMRFPIFVCEICAALEADGTVPATEDPLTDWYAAKVFKQSQAVQFSTENMNAIDFEVTDDGRGVECTFECYFDTEKKFGYRSYGDDGTWVNLYATYFPENGSLRMCYTISRDSEDINRPYYPTAEERRIIQKIMEQGCHVENSCSMEEFRAEVLQEETPPMGNEEMRLINAASICANCGSEGSAKCNFCQIGTAPTVKGSPVVLARWEKYSGAARNNPDVGRCSNCRDYYTTEATALAYCPRCGAKMMPGGAQ
jgi:hypothetical protein